MAGLLAGTANDGLALFYLLCFLVGFLFVAVSFALGIGYGGHGGQFHVGHGGDGGHIGDVGHTGLGDHTGHSATDSLAGVDAHAGAHGAGVLTAWLRPLNLSTIMAFLAWFGGVGFVLRTQFAAAALISLVTALLAGLAAGAAVFYVVARVLLRGQRALDPRDYRLPGSLARVTMPIREGGIGEIVYSKGGTRHTAGARSVDGGAIKRGTDVVILRYEDGIAYVQRWDELIADSGRATPGAAGDREERLTAEL